MLVHYKDCVSGRLLKKESCQRMLYKRERLKTLEIASGKHASPNAMPCGVDRDVFKISGGTQLGCQGLLPFRGTTWTGIKKAPAAVAQGLWEQGLNAGV